MSWLSSSVVTLRTWCGNYEFGMSLQCHGVVATLLLCFAFVCNVMVMLRHCFDLLMLGVDVVTLNLGVLTFFV